MHEASAKAQVLGFIRKAARSYRPVVTAEFTLGKSGVRADLALVAHGELVGIEIKTARDSLRRLPSQMEGYARYFDHTVLVVAECHLPGLREINLHGATVWAMSASGITTVREGHRNAVSTDSHLDLLTLQERRRFIAHGLPVRDHVVEVFTARYGATSERFWDEASGRVIRANHIALLSRFADRREAERQLAREKEARWNRWAAAFEGDQLVTA